MVSPNLLSRADANVRNDLGGVVVMAEKETTEFSDTFALQA